MIFSTGPLVRVGTIVKTHGFEGRLRFQIESEEYFNPTEPVFILMEGKPVPFFFNEISEGDNAVILLDGVDTYDSARKFSGKEVFQKGDPEADPDAWHLEGYTMIDQQLGNLGEILEQLDHGFQQIAVINYKDCECLIPIVPEIFTQVNHDTHTVYVELPEGLIELYTEPDSTDKN
ncbi:MAG: hypothetical protein GC181_04680 [Bacteroidetes bacterium]|nr:hypothetical protein [Bacteroidota bacterium]